MAIGKEKINGKQSQRENKKAAAMSLKTMQLPLIFNYGGQKSECIYKFKIKLN